MSCLFYDETHLPLFWLRKKKGLTHYLPANHSSQWQQHQQDTQSLVPVVESWADELMWFSPKDSGQRKMLHKNSNSDTSKETRTGKETGNQNQIEAIRLSLHQQRSQHQKYNHVQHWEEGYQEGKTWSYGSWKQTKGPGNHLNLVISNSTVGDLPEAKKKKKKPLAMWADIQKQGSLSQEFFKLKDTRATTQQCLHRENSQPSDGMPSKSLKW